MDDLYSLSFHPALKDLESFSCCLVENSLSRNNLLYLELPSADDDSPGNFFSFVARIEPKLESNSFIIFSAMQFLPYRELQVDVLLYDTYHPFSIASSNLGSISISLMDKARVESQEKSGWVLRKPYAPAFGFKKHAGFSPTSTSEGKNLCVFAALSLIYCISCYHGFGDTFSNTQTSHFHGY